MKNFIKIFLLQPKASYNNNFFCFLSMKWPWSVQEINIAALFNLSYPIGRPACLGSGRCPTSTSASLLQWFSMFGRWILLLASLVTCLFNVYFQGLWSICKRVLFVSIGCVVLSSSYNEIVLHVYLYLYVVLFFIFGFKA